MSTKHIPPAFNAAAARQELMQVNQYCASPNFANLGMWRKTKNYNWLCVRAPPDAPLDGLRCVVVGRMSPEKALLDLHGNFNTIFGKSADKAKVAKLQCTLDCPFGDSLFVIDYNTAYEALENVQNQTKATASQEHFLLPENRSMHFNYLLWEEKNAQNSGPTRNGITAAYSVNDDAAVWFNPLKKTHQIRRMPVYDVHGDLITKPETFADHLLGALVEVTFTLRHFHMVVTEKRKVPNDTFTAMIESISILRAPAPVLLSPFRNPSPRKQKQASQIATTSWSAPRAITQPDFNVDSPSTSSGSTSTQVDMSPMASVESTSVTPGEGSLDPLSAVEHVAQAVPNGAPVTPAAHAQPVRARLDNNNEVRDGVHATESTVGIVEQGAPAGEMVAQGHAVEGTSGNGGTATGSVTAVAGSKRTIGDDNVESSKVMTRSSKAMGKQKATEEGTEDEDGSPEEEDLPPAKRPRRG